MYQPGSWHTFWKRRLRTPFIVIIMVKFKLGWKLRDFGGEWGAAQTNLPPPYRVKPHPIWVVPTNIWGRIRNHDFTKIWGCALCSYVLIGIQISSKLLVQKMPSLLFQIVWFRVTCYYGGNVLAPIYNDRWSLVLQTKGTTPPCFEKCNYEL